MSKLEKGASYPGLEIIAMLATVLEVEPAELLRARASKAGAKAAADDQVGRSTGPAPALVGASHRPGQAILGAPASAGLQSRKRWILESCLSRRNL